MNYAVNKHKKNFTIGKILKGISNFQIEETIKQINDDDISNNFVGNFPSDKFD